jgi:hypothetical protein
MTNTLTTTKKSLLALALVAAGAFSSAQAATVIPYPNKGAENPDTYTFTATADGQVTAFFVGSDAGFTEVLGMTVNGVATGITGLNDHTSHIGDSLVLGNVHAGDSLVFFIAVDNLGLSWFSDKALNGTDGQHVYSAPYDGSNPNFGATIPAGTYIGFEDLLRKDADFNFLDDQFVLTNVSSVTVSGTPLPAALPLFASGLGALGFAGYRRRSKAASR